MPLARVVLSASDLAMLLDLPQDVVLATPSGEPAGEIELLLSGDDLPEGDVRLVYEMDDLEVPSLVRIEPVQQDA